MIENIRKWIEERQKNGSLYGIVVAPVIWLVVGIALSALFWSCETRAEGYWFPEGPVMFLYIDAPSDNIFCVGGGRELNGNSGIRQAFYKNNGIVLTGTYTHHSCAFGGDRNTYDALGFGLEWRIGK